MGSISSYLLDTHFLNTFMQIDDSYTLGRTVKQKARYWFLLSTGLRGASVHPKPCMYLVQSTASSPSWLSFLSVIRNMRFTDITGHDKSHPVRYSRRRHICSLIDE